MKKKDFYIFPYEVVPPKSKVIIYAMGNVGRCFWEQLKSNQYCEVVACIDKNFNHNIKNKYHILSPKEICLFEYDYIIVAVESDALARQIIKELNEEWDIPLNKLLFLANRKVATQSVLYTLSDAMNDRNYLQMGLQDFWTEESSVEDFFSDWIRETQKFDNEQKRALKDYLLSFQSGHFKNDILIYRLLYECRILDSESYEKYVKTVKKILYDCAKLWSLYDISVMERDNHELRYPNFYIDKRDIINSLFDDIRLDKSNLKQVNGRIAIICSDFRGERSSHNGLIIPYANEMSRQGIKVTIFPLDLFRYRNGESFIFPLEPLELQSISYEDYHRRVLRKDIDVSYPQGESILERARYIIQSIMDFAPMVVVDFCGEYSFLSGKLHEYFKIMAIPMRGYCSSGIFDLYFARHLTICLSENEIYHSVQPNQMVEALVCSEPINSKHQFKKADYNIKEDCFVITTVGSRLDSELTEEFCRTVCAFLDNNDDSCWIIVGEKYPKFFEDNYKTYINRGQIIKWGYEYDLIGFYEGICDVYWNPDRMGAGGSMGSAMRCGIPIITRDFPSDILPRLGIENAIRGDYSDCRKYVQSLHDDQELYKTKSELMKNRMTISSISNYVELLIKKARELSAVGER